MTPRIWLDTDGNPLGAESQRLLTAALEESIRAGWIAHDWAIQWHCRPEQAALFLPLGVVEPAIEVIADANRTQPI